MRRLLLLSLVILLGFFCYICISEGFQNDLLGLDIASYSTIEETSEKMTKEQAAYNKKNEETYGSAETQLSVAIKKYENTKKEYKDLIETLGIEEDSAEESNIIESTRKAYGIDFLLATIGDYATKEGIQKLDLDFVESSSVRAPANAGYVLSDLKFTVVGEYTLIAKFLYDLEDDDRLAYEIRDFNMVKNKATFTVYSIPIESASLSGFSSTSSGTTNNSGTANSGTTNTATPNTTTSTTNSVSANTTR